MTTSAAAATTASTAPATADKPEATHKPNSAAPNATLPTAAAAQLAPEPAQQAPIPVLAPYLGLVAAALSTLGGGWLLLAPYALDFRHGATHLPRAASVDLGTGAAVIAVGVTAAILFAMNLLSRLQGDDSTAVLTAQSAERPPGQTPETVSTETVPAEARLAEGMSATEPTGPQRPKEADPGNALRELLTPLVAALAADLRSHDQERTQRKAP